VTLSHSFKSVFRPSSHDIKAMNGIISQVYLTPVGPLKHYSPIWTLAFNTLLPHLFCCLPIACHVLIPITFRSSSTASVRFYHALPLFLVSSILAFTVSFGILAVFILSVCPHHYHPSDLINFTVLAPFNVSCTCLFVLLPAFFFFYGTIIFITLFLLSTLKSVSSEAILQA
jgi:hypothetical protein